MTCAVEANLTKAQWDELLHKVGVEKIEDLLDLEADNYKNAGFRPELFSQVEIFQKVLYKNHWSKLLASREYDNDTARGSGDALATAVPPSQPRPPDVATAALPPQSLPPDSTTALPPKLSEDCHLLMRCLHPYLPLTAIPTQAYADGYRFAQLYGLSFGAFAETRGYLELVNSEQRLAKEQVFTARHCWLTEKVIGQTDLFGWKGYSLTPAQIEEVSKQASKDWQREWQS